MNIKRKYSYAKGAQPDFTKQPRCSECGKKLAPKYFSECIGHTLDDGSFVAGKRLQAHYDPAAEKNRAVIEHIERQIFMGWGHRPHDNNDHFCSTKCGYAFGYKYDSALRKIDRFKNAELYDEVLDAVATIEKIR